KLEPQVALVLEPLHAVPRPAVCGGIVEGVAVAVQDVGIAIPIEVDDGDPTGTEVRVRRAPERPGGEATSSVVHEPPDLFPFLTHERDDIRAAVVVEIRDNRV